MKAIFLANTKTNIDYVYGQKNIDKIAEYIEKLNSGYSPTSRESKEYFSDGSPVNYFWTDHKEKIIKAVLVWKIKSRRLLFKKLCNSSDFFNRISKR